jgi:uncharacterized protein (TIGR00369 family)
MTPSPATDDPHEAAFHAGVREVFEEKIVFNKVIGLRIDQLGDVAAHGHLRMQPELIGHYAHQRLHGGVISAALDAMGAAAVMAAMGARHRDETAEQRLHRFGKLGTIDLRIDYLRPGVGERFELHAEVLRLGSRVASTRMSFLSADGQLLAAGAGTYIVS